MMRQPGNTLELEILRGEDPIRAVIILRRVI